MNVSLVKLHAPLINPENAEFWSAANRSELLIKKCGKCAKAHWYPRAICPYCTSSDTRWEAASGAGIIYSYTVVVHPVLQIPAYVQVDEGIIMLTQIVGASPNQLAIGAPVQVRFHEADRSQLAPIFVLA